MIISALQIQTGLDKFMYGNQLRDGILNAALLLLMRKMMLLRCTTVMVLRGPTNTDAMVQCNYQGHAGDGN